MKKLLWRGIIFLSLLACIGLFGWLSDQRPATASQEAPAMNGRSGLSAPVTESFSDGHALKEGARQLAYGGVASRQQIKLPSARLALAPEAVPVTQRLPPYELTKEHAAKSEAVGVVRSVEISARDIASGTAGFSQTGADGKTVQIISLESPNAVELRVHLTNFKLAEGEEVYIYGLDSDSPAYGPYTGRGETGNRNKHGGNFWSGLVSGERIVIEYVRVANSTGSFGISELSHRYHSLIHETHEAHDTNAQAQATPLPCHNDANCLPIQLNDAVARISFEKGGESFSCSGTMLASGPEDEFAPYFLTANHCVANATVASSVQVFWKHRSTSCNSGIGLPLFEQPKGANILKTLKVKDQTLLRILTPVPNGIFFAGWSSASWPAETKIVGLHHPRGSYLRRSEGKIIDQDDDCSATGLEDGYGIEWSTGRTEKGSSGSALFHSTNNQVLGVLSCGPTSESCSPFGDTSYGKFSQFFPYIESYLIHGDRGPSPAPVEASANFGFSGSMGTVPSRVFGEGGEGDNYYGAVFRFAGQAGQRVRFTMRSSQLDPILTLLAPVTHQLLIEDDDSGGGPTGLDAQLEFVLPTNGVYLLEASTAVSKQTGNFNLVGEIVCDFTVDKTELQFGDLVSEASLKVTSENNCPVTATQNVNWFTLTNQGSGNYKVTVQAHTGNVPRTGRITFSNGLNGAKTKEVFITQTRKCNVMPITLGQTIQNTLSYGNDCLSPSVTTGERPAAHLYQLAATQGNQLSISVGALDDTASINLRPTIRLRNPAGQIVGQWLNEGSNKYYARVPIDGSFYTIPTSGNYSIEVSSTVPASGNYRITLISPGCGYSVAAPPANVPSAGQTFTLAVTSNGCLWSTYVPVDWIQRNSPLLTTGNGTVNLTVKPNTGPARSAELLIAEKIITINQANGCAYSVTPASKSFASGGGIGTINVAPSNAACPWTVALNAPAGMVTYPLVLGSKTGNGTVNYTVNANTGAARTATFTIAGQTHAITQAAVAPNPVPTLASFAPAYVVAGGATFKLALNGTNFLPGSIVTVNGSPLEARTLSDTLIEVEIPALAIKNTGELTLAVTNASPGGGATPVRKLPIYGPSANLSAASYEAEISPDSIVAVFGNKLARGTETGRTIPLPTELLGTTVSLRDRTGKGVLAPLFFVSPTQINYLFPSGLATGPIQVTITSGNGDISVGEITLTRTAPALFTSNANGQGVPTALALRVTSTGRQIYENVATFDRAQNKWIPEPINLDNPRDQVFLILFGSGIRGNTGVNNVSASLGRARYAVNYAGAQGSLVGLDQVNMLLPNTFAGSGEITLSLIVDGNATNAVKIAVK